MLRKDEVKNVGKGTGQSEEIENSQTDGNEEGVSEKLG
jgi:hypothetical protein